MLKFCFQFYYYIFLIHQVIFRFDFHAYKQEISKYSKYIVLFQHIHTHTVYIRDYILYMVEGTL